MPQYPLTTSPTNPTSSIEELRLWIKVLEKDRDNLRRLLEQERESLRKLFKIHTEAQSKQAANIASIPSKNTNGI